MKKWIYVRAYHTTEDGRFVDDSIVFQSVEVEAETSRDAYALGMKKLPFLNREDYRLFNDYVHDPADRDFQGTRPD